MSAVAYIHICRKKPNLKSLRFEKDAPDLAAKGYKAYPLVVAQPAATPAAVQEQAAPSDELVALFREAVAWGCVYGEVIPAHQWDSMRDDMAEKFAARHGAQPAAGMVSVTQHDASNYCLILRELGMEEEGDPVAEVQRLMAQPAALVVTASPDPRGVHVAVHQGEHCVHAEVVAVPAASAEQVRDWSAINAAIDEYVDGYDLRGEPGDHTPTEFEQFLILDAINGLLAEPEFLALLAAPVVAQPQPSGNAGEFKTDDQLGGLLASIRNYGSWKYAEAKGRAEPDLSDVRAAWDEVYEKVQALAAQASGQAQDAEDAARYRWLRNHPLDGLEETTPCIRAAESDSKHWALNGNDADAAIDAARQESKGGEG
ncbi:hypothetical protein RAN3_2514 [plant metagenome]|uniref:Uncharacterized protein n=1 Tax=plant metagenome TaxID=1297885 RepID=A0A484U2C1_9ZZZZ